MSALGQKQTFAMQQLRYGPIADIIELFDHFWRWKSAPGVPW
jgi:hypothetical protein